MCGHTTLLQPHHLPSQPDVTLYPPLPDLSSVQAHTPSSVWATALESLRMWLHEVLRVLPLGGCATPPLWVGDEWIFCWNGPVPQQDPPCPPLHGLPLRYTRSPTGTWIMGLPAPTAPLIAAPICPSCVRPCPHTATIVSHVT